MNFLTFNLKAVLCYSIMLGGLLRVHAAEHNINQLSTEQRMFELREVHRVSMIYSLLSPLEANIEPALRYINIEALRRDCEEGLKSPNEGWLLPRYNVGVYSIINLSSIPITLAKHKILPKTCSIFIGGYDGYSSNIPFHGDNTLFLNLNIQNYSGCEDSLLVHEELPVLSENVSHLATVFSEPSVKDQESAKKLLLAQYWRYAQEPECLYERKNAFPQLSCYLEDPQAYIGEIEGKKVVFTYTKTFK